MTAVAVHPALEAPLVACARGDLAPNVALMRLLCAAETAQEAATALAEMSRRLDPDLPASTRLGALARLWRETPGAWAIVRSVLAEAGGGVLDADPASRAAAFDRVARISPDSGVALYALGRADILDAATMGIVRRLDEWHLLAPGARVLDLGCGSGRLSAAVAAHVASVTGLDVAAGMLTAARGRCAGLANVRLLLTDGRDLAGLPEDDFDLVLAVDVFPYLVASPGLAGRHFAECRRVLVKGGTLLVLNYSYRGDYDGDEREVRILAMQHEFRVVRMAAGDFPHWDGRTFHLQKMA